MPEVLVDSYYIERLKDKINKLSSQVSKLNQELKKTAEDRDHAEFRIRTELEPRIRREERSYDAWVSQQTGEAECLHFEKLVDKVCDFVDSEYGECFEWEESDGDLYQMILFLVKNREDIDIYKIEEKEDNA